MPPETDTYLQKRGGSKAEPWEKLKRLSNYQEVSLLAITEVLTILQHTRNLGSKNISAGQAEFQKRIRDVHPPQGVIK